MVLLFILKLTSLFISMQFFVALKNISVPHTLFPRSVNSIYTRQDIHGEKQRRTAKSTKNFHCQIFLSYRSPQSEIARWNNEEILRQGWEG